MMTRQSLIVALSENQVIGRDGRLPWHLSGDLRRFKQLTMGHTIVMGRKTYESIGRPLPGRTSIVITRQPDYRPPGVTVAASLDEARRLAAGDTELFYIGGGEIYRQVLPIVERIYMTRVHAQVTGDTAFPELASSQWRLMEQTEHGADKSNDFPFSILVYERVRTMSKDVKQELLDLTERLLASISQGNWDDYQLLCDPSITAFEPEARGQQVEGMAFHKYYFDLGGARTPKHVTICAPHVRLLGPDAAVVSYVRLVQYLDASGATQTSRSEETRVWQRLDGGWQHVHFHRSTTA
jgi:dihydrofolate reductase